MNKLFPFLTVLVCLSTVGCKPPISVTESKENAAVAYGLRADVGFALGANALVAAVGGDRIGLVAIVGLQIGGGLSVEGVRIWWDTPDGSQTIAGKYFLQRPKGTFIYSNPKDSIATYARNDWQKMYIQGAGIGLNANVAEGVVVVPLGVPRNGSKVQAQKAFEKWKSENGFRDY